MNFFDLIVLTVKALKRLINGVANSLGALIRLSYRQWYVVGVVMLLMAVLALVYSRPSNRRYQVDGLLALNGPSLSLVKQVLKPIEQGTCMKDVVKLRSYDVIDCLADSTADFVDYKSRTSLTDTLHRHMTDYLAIRFQIRDTASLGTIENELLAYLNSYPQIQNSYACYAANLREEAVYCHTQMQRLDSLTHAFYFEQGVMPQVASDSRNLLIGDRRIHLFLDDINGHIAHTNFVDQRLARATAPVVVEGTFALQPIAKNHPVWMVLFALLAGYLLGCLIALMIEKRKAISAWLKQ